MRNHRFVVCLLILSLAGTAAHCAFERLPAGGRNRALAGATQVSKNDPFCLETNPASAEEASAPCVAFSFSPGSFGLTELQRMEVAAMVPAFGGSLGVVGRSFGFDLYRETTLLGAFGVEVSQGVFFGLSAAWYNLRIAGYGHAGCMGLGLGVTARLAEQLRYGVSLRNINQPTLGQTEESVHGEILSAVEFSPVPSFLLALGLTKVPDFAVSGSVGAEWQVADAFAIRVGADEGLDAFSAGFGIRILHVDVDYGVSIHPDLGLTHAFSLLIAFP